MFGFKLGMNGPLKLTRAPGLPMPITCLKMIPKSSVESLGLGAEEHGLRRLVEEIKDIEMEGSI